MAETEVIEFADSALFTFDPTKIEFVGLRVQLKEISPGVFPTDNPTVVTKNTTPLNSLFSFFEDSIKPAGSEIKYILSVDEVDQYHDGSNWVVSDGTFSQSNLATEVDANRQTFAVSGITKLKTFLNSDGTVTPQV